MTISKQALFEKLKSLPQQRLAEVEDFVDFLRARQEAEQLTKSATQASEPSFASVWNNDDDAAYDQL